MPDSDSFKRSYLRHAGYVSRRMQETFLFCRNLSLRRRPPGLDRDQWNAVATALFLLSNRGVPRGAIERCRRGIMLADDVGKGKTYEALAILAYIRKYEPTKRVLVLLPSLRLLNEKWLNIGCQRRREKRDLLCLGRKTEPVLENEYLVKPAGRPHCVRPGSACPACRHRLNLDCEGALPAFFRSSKSLLKKPGLFKPSDICVQRGRRRIEDMNGTERARNFRVLFTTFGYARRPSRRHKATIVQRRGYWDYIVVEECHHLRYRDHGRWKTLDELRRQNRDARFIFLTATPYQINAADEIVNILSFLDYRYEDVRNSVNGQDIGGYCRLLEEELQSDDEHGRPRELTLEQEQKWAPFIQRTKKSLVAQIDIGLRRLQARYDRALDEGNLKQLRETVEKLYHWSDLDHDDMPGTNYLTTSPREQQGLDDYLRQFMIRSEKKRLKAPEKPIRPTELDEPAARRLPPSLSYLRVREYLSLRGRMQGNTIAQGFRMLQYCSGDEVMKGYMGRCSSRRHKQELDVLLRKARLPLKRNALVGVLRRDVWKTFPFSDKIVVFCRHHGVKPVIRSAVQERLKEIEEEHRGSIKSACRSKRRIPREKWEWAHMLVGRKGLRKRGIAVDCNSDARRGFNRQDSLPLMLIVTGAHSEGVDMEKGKCTKAVHFEMHWNPAVIEQREGRIYRGSQIANQREFRLWALVIPETLEQRMYETCRKRARLKDFLLGNQALDKLLDNEQAFKGIVEDRRSFRVNLDPIEFRKGQG